ncbi:hypothetical protein AU476_12175 [Cupriavidus sp. UYMSc13B]|nr:hypothetical protein AU476_12175 [Cupriavidus sp. UYMSc13B]
MNMARQPKCAATKRSHPRQQDAQQQSGHDRPDHLAALRRGRQHRCSGTMSWAMVAARPTTRLDTSNAPMPGAGPPGASADQRHRLGHDDAAAVIAVAQRRQQQDAQRIAELRQGRDGAGCESEACRSGAITPSMGWL